MSHFVSQLQSYALGQLPEGQLKGYFAKHCSDSKFIFDNEIMAVVAVTGFIFLGIFVLFVPALLRDYVQKYILPSEKRKSHLHNPVKGKSHLSTLMGFSGEFQQPLACLTVLHSTVT